MRCFNAAGFRALLAAVIDRALTDLKGIGPKCKRIETDRAMAFILSGACEAYCLELEIDYRAVTENAVEGLRKCTGISKSITQEKTKQGR